MRRSMLLMLGLTLPLMAGCYGSHGEEGEDDAGADDATTADEATPGEDVSAEDVAPEDALPEVDAEADAMPDSTVECPPLMDGTWVDFTIDGPTFEAVDVDTPCRMNLVVGGPPGHEAVRLECGTGGMMTEYTIDFFANPPVSLSFWDGLEVSFRYVADPVWWIDRWFTVRSASGALLFAGTNASHLAPWGEDVGAWYDPLDIAAVGGFCPAEDSGCGPEERQALDVGFAGSRQLIFDGYQGYVGDMLTASVHVGTATHHLEMTCDDVPDDWTMFVIVMIPEG